VTGTDVGVDDVNVNDAEVEEVNEGDKDTDVDVVVGGVAVDEDEEEVMVNVEEDEAGVERGIAEVVVTGVDDMGADVVDTEVDAGDVRPPYVQSEFKGILGP